MIDLHTHVLPGLDDGSVDLDMSLRMLAIAEGDGIKTIVGTPHFVPGYYAPVADEVRAAAARLKDRARAEGFTIEIRIAHEIRAAAGIMHRLRHGEILAYDPGQRYILLEMPGGRIPDWMDQLIFELQIGDVIPIIAHPERNSDIIKNPMRLYDFALKGCLFQLTAASLLGRFGEKVKQTSDLLLEHDFVHTIASDAHNDEMRVPELAAARVLVEAAAGKERALALFETYPRHILEGTDFYSPEPRRIETDGGGSLFGRIRKFLT